MSALTYGFTAQQIIDDGRITNEDINFIKNWLTTKNHLPKLTNEQIISFLLSCNKKQEPTKATIKAYYSAKRNAPQLFDNRNLDREDLQSEMRAIEYSALPERTDNGCAVIFARLFDTVYYHFNIEPAIKILFMTIDAAIHNYPPNALVILFDMKGMGIMHLTRVKLHAVKIFCQYLQEGLPVKLHSVHVLNAAYFIDKVMAILKPFVKAEVLERVHFHSPNLSMEQFYDRWIPKRCLPADYGGDLPTVSTLHQENIRKLTQMQPHFEAEELQRHNIQ